jgi:hypothetical protein
VKRICLLGAAIAGLLIIGVASALASAPRASTNANAAKTKTTKPTTKLSCTSSLSLQVPSGDTTVTQGAADGTQYGSVKCGTPFGQGVQFETFTTDGSGNLAGKIQQYFGAGSIFGTYTLVPSDQGPPTTSTFTSSSYIGTVKIKGGTGLDKNAKGTGTLKCSSADAVHFTCSEKLKLTAL